MRTPSWRKDSDGVPSAPSTRAPTSALAVPLDLVRAVGNLCVGVEGDGAGSGYDARRMAGVLLDGLARPRPAE